MPRACPRPCERLLALGDQRISKNGVIIIKAQEHRSLEKNRAEALRSLQALVDAASHVQKARRTTAQPRRRHPPPRRQGPPQRHQGRARPGRNTATKARPAGATLTSALRRTSTG
jgi:ribosome-associated protein